MWPDATRCERGRSTCAMRATCPRPCMDWRAVCPVTLKPPSLSCRPSLPLTPAQGRARRPPPITCQPAPSRGCDVIAGGIFSACLSFAVALCLFLSFSLFLHQHCAQTNLYRHTHVRTRARSTIFCGTSTNMKLPLAQEKKKLQLNNQVMS